MSSKGRPYRTVVVENFEIFVGRDAQTNDELSLRIAEPHDHWLHVGGGCPGSHVVIRNPQREAIPPSVLAKAAQLAAWFSKARNQRKVEVHCCRASDVSKVRGAPAGQVQIRRFTKQFVEPMLVESEPRTAPEPET